MVGLAADGGESAEDPVEVIGVENGNDRNRLREWRWFTSHHIEAIVV